MRCLEPSISEIYHQQLIPRRARVEPESTAPERFRRFFTEEIVPRLYQLAAGEDGLQSLRPFEYFTLRRGNGPWEITASFERDGRHGSTLSFEPDSFGGTRYRELYRIWSELYRELERNRDWRRAGYAGRRSVAFQIHTWLAEGYEDAHMRQLLRRARVNFHQLRNLIPDPSDGRLLVARRELEALEHQVNQHFEARRDGHPAGRARPNIAAALAAQFDRAFLDSFGGPQQPGDPNAPAGPGPDGPAPTTLTLETINRLVGEVQRGGVIRPMSVGPGDAFMYLTAQHSREQMRAMYEGTFEIPEPTPQERAAQVDRATAQLLEFYELEQRDKKAQARAEKLLKEQLSPEQLAEYTRHRHFHVIGNKTGKRYRIQYGRQINIRELNKEGKVVRKLCFLPAGGLVEGDVMLAQKLALEVQEDAALKVANTFAPDPELVLGVGSVNDPGREDVITVHGTTYRPRGRINPWIT